MKDIDIFAERLKQARKTRNLSQQKLGNRANINASQIAHFESGNRLPSMNNTRNLAKALIVSADYLLGIQDAMTNENSGVNKDFHNLSDDDIELIKTITNFLSERKKEASNNVK
jgi:transcriptional regulator with XRE-family HTH domain